MRNQAVLGIPAGLVRLLFLHWASKMPTSGMDAIERSRRLTNDLWLPSPGSVYYVISELHDRQLLAEVPSDEPTVKRYVTTTRGRAELEKFRQLRDENFRKLVVTLILLGEIDPKPPLQEMLAVAQHALSKPRPDARS